MNIDISKIWPGWTITERLGHGGFGHVYKAIRESTQAVAAVKVIPITGRVSHIGTGMGLSAYLFSDHVEHF